MLGYPDPLTAARRRQVWPRGNAAGARPNAQSVVKRSVAARASARTYGALAYGFRTALDAQGAGAVAHRHRAADESRRLRPVVSGARHRAGSAFERRCAGAATPRVTVYRIDDRATSRRRSRARAAAPTATGELDLRGVDVERCSVLRPRRIKRRISASSSPKGADVATVTRLELQRHTRASTSIAAGRAARRSLAARSSATAQMYQPGERGEMTGIAYYVKGSQRRCPTRTLATSVTLTDPEQRDDSSLGTREDRCASASSRCR